MKKKYKIETIEQLVNIVTDENFERLTLDFLMWLDFVNKVKNKDLKVKFKVDFIWIDDGKTGIIQSELLNTTTGEIKNIKHK